MRITPITNANVFMRYRIMDGTRVLDSFTNQVFKTSSASRLLDKLNKIGSLNARIIDMNATRPLKQQKRLLEVVA